MSVHGYGGGRGASICGDTVYLGEAPCEKTSILSRFTAFIALSSFYKEKKG